MAKIKIANSNIDSLLDASGKAKVVTRTSSNDSKIENSSKDLVKISVISSKIMEDEGEVYEVAKIKITANNKKRSTISSVISNGRQILNHVCSTTKMYDLSSGNLDNIGQSTPVYSINAQFNYISDDYDALQSNIPEHNLNSFLDECTKDEVLNFKRLKSAKLSTFSRGDQMKNFVAPQGAQDKFSKSCPYSINIKLNDNVGAGVSKFLQKISIYDELLNDYLQTPKADLQFNVQSGRTATEDVEYMGYDITSFFTSDIEIDLDNFYGQNQESISSKMSYDLRRHLFKGYLKSVFKTGFRRYEDIVNNVECYKENLCYSLEKFDEFELDSTRIQNIFLPASESSTSFTDTQVKYGTTYVYRVKAHYMIVGNSYRYRNIRYYDEDGVTYATAEVVNKPSIMLIPFDLFSTSKAVIQPPPVFPQVTFKTENNAESEIQIYLSPTKNDHKAYFVEVLEKDAQQKEFMEQNYSNQDGMFTFHTSMDSGLYEVFRLSYAPKNISEFSNSKLGEVRMSYRDTDAIFRDTVKPNEDYYYMFRQVNQKGMVSNPTSIFKAQLVVDADDAKVFVDTYDYPKQVMSEPRKNFKTLLQIKPAVEQVLFAEDQDALYGKASLRGTIDDLKLGTQREAVWGRKFKLRVRSKTSGKMIDININFELAKNKSKEEF